MQTAFAKYEGAGNDFILIDNREGGFTPRAELIAALCDRHFGIGADGLMTLARNAEIDCSMRYYNADGSEGEMCGNGARCFTLFAEHRGIGGETKFFDAADGLHTARIRRLKGTSGEIELGMIAVREIRTGDGWWFLNTGVPHYVEFVDDLEAVDVTGRGRAIRRDTARCAKGCGMCKRSCPVSVHPDPDALAAGECISCGRCADGCPLENVTVLRVPDPRAATASKLAEAPGAKKAQVKEYLVRLRGTEVPLVLIKAAALFALCWLFV